MDPAELKHLEQQRLVAAGFNVYRTDGVADALSPPQVFTCFRGVPIASAVTVTDVDESGVTFRVGCDQANALAHTSFALIKSPLHGMTFRARARRVEGDANLTYLCDFVRHTGQADRRANARLEPDQHVEVLVRCGVDIRCGYVLDVSVDSLAVYMNGDNPAAWARNRVVGVRLELPRRSAEGAIAIDAEATVIRVRPWLDPESRACQVVLRLDVGDTLRERLRRYLAEWQSEVVAELSRDVTESA